MKYLTLPKHTSYHTLKMLTQKLHFFSRLVTYCWWTQLSETWEWFSSLIRFDRTHPDSVFSDPRILMNRTLNNSFKWLMLTSVLAEQNASPVVAVVVVVVVGSLLWIVKMGLWYFVIEASPSSPETETKWTFCTPNLIVTVASYIPISNDSPFSLVPNCIFYFHYFIIFLLFFLQLEFHNCITIAYSSEEVFREVVFRAEVGDDRNCWVYWSFEQAEKNRFKLNSAKSGVGCVFFFVICCSLPLKWKFEG